MIGFFFCEKFIQAKGVIVVIIHDVVFVHDVDHVFVAGGEK